MQKEKEILREYEYSSYFFAKNQGKHNVLNELFNKEMIDLFTDTNNNSLNTLIHLYKIHKMKQLNDIKILYETIKNEDGAQQNIKQEIEFSMFLNNQPSNYEIPEYSISRKILENMKINQIDKHLILSETKKIRLNYDSKTKITIDQRQITILIYEITSNTIKKNIVIRKKTNSEPKLENITKILYRIINFMSAKLDNYSSFLNAAIIMKNINYPSMHFIDSYETNFRFFRLAFQYYIVSNLLDNNHEHHQDSQITELSSNELYSKNPPELLELIDQADDIKFYLNIFEQRLANFFQDLPDLEFIRILFSPWNVKEKYWNLAKMLLSNDDYPYEKTHINYVLYYNVIDEYLEFKNIEKISYPNKQILHTRFIAALTYFMIKKHNNINIACPSKDIIKEDLSKKTFKKIKIIENINTDPIISLLIYLQEIINNVYLYFLTIFYLPPLANADEDEVNNKTNSEIPLSSEEIKQLEKEYIFQTRTNEPSSNADKKITENVAIKIINRGNKIPNITLHNPTLNLVRY